LFSKQLKVMHLYKDLGFHPSSFGGMPGIGELEQVPVETKFRLVDKIKKEAGEYFEDHVDVKIFNNRELSEQLKVEDDEANEVSAIEEATSMDTSVKDTSMEEIDNPFESGEDGLPGGSFAIVNVESVVRPPVEKRLQKFEVPEIWMDGKKWYACTVCEARYEDRMELMQHMRQHNPDRPFHCKCGKSFIQAAHLKVHKRQHTGEKPFKCTVCGKRFRQKTTVDQHMRTHTQLRPYACTYANCDKSFAQKTTLDNHIKSHQSGRLSEAFKKQKEEQKLILAQLQFIKSYPITNGD